MSISIPGVHRIAHKYNAKEAKSRIASSKCKRTVLGKEEGSREENRKYGPEPILKFLSMMETARFICNEKVQAIQQRYDTGAEYGRCREKCQQSEESKLPNGAKEVPMKRGRIRFRSYISVKKSMCCIRRTEEQYLLDR